MAYSDLLRTQTWTGTDAANLIDGLIPAVQNGTYTYGGVSTGSANAQVITTGQAPSAYANGQIFSFRAGYTNTGATTLNAHSLGAIAVQDNNTRAALVGGEIVAGSHYFVQYYSAVFYLLNPTSGAWISYTATPTGFSANPTTLAYYKKDGRAVTVNYRTVSAGTSNATTFTVAAPFAAATITNMRWHNNVLETVNNSAQILNADVTIGSGASVFTLRVAASATSWTASGQKYANFQIIYEAAS
jgi:hypothetical protein